MLKKILLFLFLLTSFILHPISVIPTRSAEEFLIDSTVEYKIEDSGKTEVKHIISLENAFSTLYAKEYSLVLEGIEVTNPQVYSGGQPLKFELKRELDSVTFRI